MTTSTTDRATITSLLASAYKGQWDAWPAVCDLLEETSSVSASDLRWYRRTKKTHYKGAVRRVEDDLVKAGILTWDDCPSLLEAIAFQVAVKVVKLKDVPIMTPDRIYRKERAVLCRKLFTRLKLKGASITAPDYSMAQTVDVSLPKRRDFTVNVNSPDFQPWNHEHIDRAQQDPAQGANRECEAKVRHILAAAFPNCDDRSDSQTDHYDYCWSID